MGCRTEILANGTGSPIALSHTAVVVQRISRSSSLDTTAVIHFHGELAEDGSRSNLQQAVESLIEQLPEGTVPPTASPGRVMGYGPVTHSNGSAAPETDDDGAVWHVSAWDLGRGTLFVVHNVEGDWTLTAWSVDELEQRLSPSQTPKRAAS